MGFQRVEGGWRYNFGGMKTNTAADEMSPIKYPYAKNVRMVKSLQTRPGYSLHFATSLIIDTTCPLPVGEVGVPYSDTLASSGGQVPYTWTIPTGVLPGGLSLVGATGVVSGTPTTPETQSFVLKVTDLTLRTVSKPCSLHIFAAIAITTACPLPDGQVGSSYDQQFVASGGSGTEVWTITAGALPTGLTMSSSGEITGMPTTNAVSTFTVHVQDSLGGVDSKSCQITITPACFNFADDFNRADGALGTPWSWISESSGHQADIVSNQFSCSALGTAEITTAPDTNVTGYSEVTNTVFASRCYGGPMVLRKTVTINNNRYIFIGGDSGPGTANRLMIVQVGSTGFNILVATGFIYAANGADFTNKPMRLTFDVQASKVVLTAYLSGVQVLTVDDSAGTRFTSGKPGISIGSTSGGAANSWDNFSCHTCP